MYVNYSVSVCLSVIDLRKHYGIDLTDILYKDDWFTQKWRRP